MADRIHGLDIARGIAILGTLGTNIWIFSHPAGMLGYLGSPTTPGAPAWQATAERALQQVANGKFLGLLTLMFGIGLAIQADAAARHGRRWPGSYPWRAALLFLDGVLNYLLVIEFDVLMGYAVTGVIVAYLLATSPRTQRTWILIMGGLHLLLIGWLSAAFVSGVASFGSTASIDPNPYRDGSWWDLVALRIDNAVIFRFEPVLIGFGSIALFLIGARLYRAGMFDPERGSLRRRCMIIGAVALVADLTLGMMGTGWLPLTRWVLAPIAAVGLLGLIAELTTGRSPGWIGRRLADLGRVALSGYVLQNVIASVAFYGWGFGLNSMPPAWRLPVTVVTWLAISVIICTLAHLWLRRFERGPLEWLWARGYAALTTRRRPDPVDAR
ncbi:uncharacterized protein GGQ54_002099 [Naumannella cuiyingiana]|uniref:DUF418 domain-containing protein n=1 Tax=Naumannella cuiyingiana TaxID=1347891 RepID=A0A7Z0ILD6_9ACTN|nr:DUF418 domain-containing protein [Naumannella cuiyingiana]NYI71539.1 uncharacterized protein [Naumannella cuiyingiana]